MREDCVQFPIRVAVIFAVVSFVFSGAAAFAASAENGKKAFISHGCWQCHGFEGQGSIATSNGLVIAHTELPFEAFESFRPQHQARDAALRGSYSVESRPHGYLRLSAVGAETAGRSQYPAAQSLTVAPLRVDAGEPSDCFDDRAGIGLALSGNIMRTAVRH